MDLNGLSMSSLYKTTDMAFYVLMVFSSKLGKRVSANLSTSIQKKKKNGAKGNPKATQRSGELQKRLMSAKKPNYQRTNDQDHPDRSPSE